MSQLVLGMRMNAPRSGCPISKHSVKHTKVVIVAPPVVHGSRAGVQANWDEVFSAAAAAGVAVEIDGDPSRQDLDYTLARRALAVGCLFALMVMRTPSRSSRPRKLRSRTRDSPAFQPTASLIAGHWRGCSIGSA